MTYIPGLDTVCKASPATGATTVPVDLTESATLSMLFCLEDIFYTNLQLRFRLGKVLGIFCGPFTNDLALDLAAWRFWHLVDELFRVNNT
jgi:hypothetical protein